MTAQARIDVVARSRETFARGDFDGLGEIVTKYPLEFWFGLLPSEVHGMLDAVPRSVLRRNPTASALLRVLASAPLPSDQGSTSDERELGVSYAQFKQGIALAQATQARLAGDPVRAFTMMRALGVVAESVPSLIDPSRGERTFALVQAGISGMLAGRFMEALPLFEKSLVPPIPPGLAFLNRDAHVRSAMIHVLYGDPGRAASHLAASREVPRTGSWVEQILDTDERMVEVMLRPRSESVASFEELSTMTVGQMHELWPFHVVALNQLSLYGDHVDAGRRRLAEIEAAGVMLQPGVGFAGSIFSISAAFEAMLGGAVSRAQQLLDGADDRLWLTKLLLALTAAGGGAPARALRLARSISSQTRGLLQAETSRLLVVALAQHGQGHSGAALETLREIAPTAVGLGGALLARFSPSLVELAAAELPGWEAWAASVPSDLPPIEEQLLSNRELEVLVGLARGDSRDQIAQSLFLSLNTVKTHQRSLYRKLGASSSSEAIREGRRRGLV